MPKNLLKRLLSVICLLLLIVLISLGSVLINPNLLRPLISAGGQRFAGYDIQIDALESHRTPLRLEISKLQINNPEWPEPLLLDLQSLSLKLLDNPFSGRPFWTLEIAGATLNIARDNDGAFNWITSQLSGAEKSAPTEALETQTILPADFNFEHFQLRELVINWRDAEAPLQTLTLQEIDGQRLLTAKSELNILLSYQSQDIALSSTITLFDPQQGVLDYQLSLRHQELSIDSEGRLMLNPDLTGSDIGFQIGLNGTEKLNTLLAEFGASLPPLPASGVSAQLAISSHYELDELKLFVGDNKLTGTLRSTPQFDDIQLSASADTLDIDALLNALQATPNAEESLAIAESPAPAENTPATKETELDWQWMDRRIAVTLEAKQLSASGWQVDDLKLDLKTSKTITLNTQASRIEELATQRVISPLQAELSLEPLARKTLGADAKINLKLNQGDIALTATGPVNLNGQNGSEVSVTLNSPRSAELWKLALLDWQEAGAVNITADFNSLDEMQIQMAANLGEQASRIDLSIEPSSVPRITGTVVLEHLDLDFINAASVGDQSKAPAAPKEPAKPTKTTRLISNEPLALEALKQLNGNIKIQLKDIDTGYSRIRTATLTPVMDDGMLSIEGGKIQFEDGAIDIDTRLDARQQTAKLQLKLAIDSDNYGNLGLEKAAGILEGNGGIRVNLSSLGKSPAELAGNLNGRMDMKVKDLKAKGNALDLIGSDVLTETFNKLNPFAQKKEYTDIECVAIHFKGEKGQFFSKQGLSLETDATKILGTGNIDLGEEEILFSITPIARGGVGVNLGAAASLVRLGGTFSKPRVEVDPSGVLSSSLSTGAAIYTGGLSILAQGLLKRALYAGSACDGELETIPELETLPEQIELPEPIPGATPSDALQDPLAQPEPESAKISDAA